MKLLAKNNPVKYTEQNLHLLSPHNSTACILVPSTGDTIFFFKKKGHTNQFYTKRIKTFIKHCKLHSFAFKYTTPQSINSQSNPTVVHSFTTHELGRNSVQLTSRYPI